MLKKERILGKSWAEQSWDKTPAPTSSLIPFLPSGGGEVRSQESGVRINGNYRGDSRKNRSLIFLSNS
ncbi:hypothetical protein D5R40_15390 [Okeania hirsuta]|uniref:Uncharacterized protein n=2 Tax=Microcoleaceae TaxID=1892252 RepID=A0A3N6PK28_9CYAN|nr:hypothetical protein D5R40_15390 [Okeania hirsuta]